MPRLTLAAPFLLALAGPVAAAPCGGSFGDFLAAMKAEAIGAGQDPATVEAFFRGVRPDPRALKADRVRLVRDGTLTSRAVEVDYHLERSFPQLGVPDTQWVVLRSGLAPGDLVLVNAARGLPDGALVQAATVDGGVMASGGSEGDAGAEAAP